MEELRPEIRAAFEKEQAAHPPMAAMRRNVVEAVTVQPRPARHLQWVAVAAAAILGILVVAGLMSTRLGHRAGAPVPAATPKASPVGDYGPPPAGVNLLYVHDPNHPSWLIGYDWQGQPRGTVKLAQPTEVTMAPDGSAFEVTIGAKGGSGDFLDRLGRLVPGVPAPGMPVGIWADDNRHLCVASNDPHTSSWRLGTQLPGEIVRSVAVLPGDPGGGQTTIGVVACSIRNDLAILVRTTIAWPYEMWTVRISDGTVLSHTTYPDSHLLANVVASRDAAYIAENSSKSMGQPDLTAPSTIIRRVSDMSVVATLDPSMGVLAFSGDDSLVLVDSHPLVVGQPTLLSVIDVRSGKALPWQDQGTSALGGFVAQPGGRDFALAFTNLGTNSPGAKGQAASILIIHGDGSVSKFPGLSVPTW
jgi:hypothetical protein